MGERVLDSSGSGQTLVTGSCERNNEPSGSINDGNFLSGWATAGISSRTQLYRVSYLIITCDNNQFQNRRLRLYYVRLTQRAVPDITECAIKQKTRYQIINRPCNRTSTA
jgi:hypothetical protein